MSARELYCFFDTNFLSKLERSLGTDKLDKYFELNFRRPFLSQIPIYMVFNPVVFMEYAGEKLPGITDIPKRLRRPAGSPPDRWISELFKWVRSETKKQSLRATPNIIKIISQKKCGAVAQPARYRFFEGAEGFLKRVESTFVDDLSYYALFNVLSGLEHSEKEFKRFYQVRAVQFLFGRLAEGGFAPVGKISATVIAELRAAKDLKAPVDLSSLPSEDLLEAWGWASDFGDEVLLTSAIFGVKNQAGQTCSVDCFTCDNKDEFIARVRAVLLVLAWIRSTEEDRKALKKEKLYQVPDACFGRVHFYDSETGRFELVDLNVSFVI